MFRHMRFLFQQYDKLFVRHFYDTIDFDNTISMSRLCCGRIFLLPLTGMTVTSIWRNYDIYHLICYEQFTNSCTSYLSTILQLFNSKRWRDWNIVGWIYVMMKCWTSSIFPRAWAKVLTNCNWWRTCILKLVHPSSTPLVSMSQVSILNVGSSNVRLVKMKWWQLLKSPNRSVNCSYWTLVPC